MVEVVPGFRPESFAAGALMRIACTGLTLQQAQEMDDNTLLRFPLIGRKTLRYIRWSVSQDR